MQARSLTTGRQLSVCVAFVLCCLVSLRIARIQQVWWELSAVAITKVDTLVESVRNYAGLLTGLTTVHTLQSHLQILESENRRVWALYGQAADHLAQSQAIATIAAQFPRRQVPQARALLSTDANGWFVLGETLERVATGSAVVIEGVYIGTVTSTEGFRARVQVMGEGVPIAVKHVPSGQVGTLQTQQGKETAEFFDVIPAIAPDQLLVTIADRDGVPNGLPICIITQVITNPSDPVSRVVCRPLVTAKAGMYVDIVAHTAAGQ